MLLKWIEAIYVWLLARQARKSGWDYEKAKAIACKMVASIPDDIESHFAYQASEAEILSHRLGRRYDVGMALNEAAERAMAAKKAAGAEADMPQLTDRQKAALRHQEEYLQRLVNRA